MSGFAEGFLALTVSGLAIGSRGFRRLEEGTGRLRPRLMDAAVEKKEVCPAHGRAWDECRRRPIYVLCDRVVGRKLSHGRSMVCCVDCNVVLCTILVVNAGGAGREGEGVGRRRIAGDVHAICGGWRFVGNAMGDVTDSTVRAGRRPLRSNACMHWPRPPSTPSPFPNAERILVEWGQTQGVWGYKLEVLRGLLHKDYLLRLPLPRGCKGFENLQGLEPRQLRYLFRRQCAVVLGWRQRIAEGDPHGFSDGLNRTLREEVFCDL